MAVSAIVVAPAVAGATVGNSLTIIGPSTAQVGVPFHYKVKGTSTKTTNRKLSAFANTAQKCPRTYKGELATPFAPTQVTYPVRYHSFVARYKITPRSKGPHYICVYLYVGSTKRTLVHASHKYVTS
ncbi:MAG: hypothetical protein ACJ764_04730 [Solirubrobacteraceae bacterium]